MSSSSSRRRVRRGNGIPASRARGRCARFTTSAVGEGAFRRLKRGSNPACIRGRLSRQGAPSIGRSGASSRRGSRLLSVSGRAPAQTICSKRKRRLCSSPRRAPRCQTEERGGDPRTARRRDGAARETLLDFIRDDPAPARRKSAQALAQEDVVHLRRWRRLHRAQVASCSTSMPKSRTRRACIDFAEGMRDLVDIHYPRAERVPRRSRQPLNPNAVSDTRPSNPKRYARPSFCRAFSTVKSHLMRAFS